MFKERSKNLQNQTKKYYAKLMSVTKTERLNDFNKYRNPSILVNDIKKGKIKLAEA